MSQRQAEMLRAAIICIFLLLVRRRNPYLAGMTTQQKTAAIQSIVTNHQDNIAAVQAAKVSAGLEALVIEAMNTALKADLALILHPNRCRQAVVNYLMCGDSP